MCKKTRTLVNLLITVIMSLLLITTVTFAASSRTVPQGNAADFAVAYPWIVVGLVLVLFSIIIKLINKYDLQREAKIDRIVNELATTTAKLDSTINTLFDHDREIEKTLSEHATLIARIQTNCDARSRLCPISGDKLYCLDRRDGNGRRLSNGHERREEFKTGKDD